MANRTGRFPVREVYDKFESHVSKVTINNDFQALEEAGLIKREKVNHQHSFIIPLFEDSGTEEKNAFEQRKEFWLNFGLPIINVVLLVMLFAVHSSGI